MTNKSDTQNTEFKISNKSNKTNDLSDKNNLEEISANTTQTNSDDINLTEQWKQGKLKEGIYYVKLNDTLGLEIAKLTTDQGYPIWQTFGHQIRKDRIKEVLVRVPSCDEMRLIALKVDVICEKIAEMAVENQQLKELLKQCLDEIHELAEIQDNRSMTIYNFLSAELLTQINNAIGYSNDTD